MKGVAQTTGDGGRVFTASDIAVVIAAYNAESTLSATLASVASQSHLPGSVIVVDDGSVDGTAGVAGAWRDRLPVRLVSHASNRGLGQARRSGIDAAIEPLVAILDADDIWLPDHLNVMLKTYQGAFGLVTADAFMWMPGVGLSRRTIRGLRPIPALPRQRTRILVENFVFVGVLFARDDYFAVGGFRDGILGAEDWDLWIRMIRAGLPVTGSPYPTVLYRLHRAALSRGQYQVTSEARVLDLATREAAAPDERAAARHGARILGARLSLEEAYARAREGDIRGARKAALRALRGRRSVALRAAAVLFAPGPSVRFRDRHEWSPATRLGR